MKNIIVIPARYNSSRLRGKVLLKIGNKTLIEWVLENVSKSKIADDIKEEEDSFVIYTNPKDFHYIKEELIKNGIEIDASLITLIPNNTIKIEGENAKRVLKLYNALDEHDDVQEVYANFDIEKDILESFYE